MPYPFPIKPFVANGVWEVGPPPDLPSKLQLRAVARGASAMGVRQLSFSIRGSSHIRVAIGPRALVTSWSLGHISRKGGHEEDAGLPPSRPDCDCYFLLF